MPQLDITTYFSQVFWLVIIFSVMFGVFIGIFLPKISRIFQKRFDSKKQIDSEVLHLQQSTLHLKNLYEEKKDTALKKAHDFIEHEIAAIKQTHEKRLQELEAEIQTDIKRLQDSHHKLHDNFDELYKEIIKEATMQISATLGMHHGR